MKHYLWIACLLISVPWMADAQSFELNAPTETLKGRIGEEISAPLHLKNTTDKPIILIISKIESIIGGTQRAYFCIDGDCSDPNVNELTVKIQPGQTREGLRVVLEGGLVAAASSVKYQITNRSFSTETVDFELHFVVEDSPERQALYSSAAITVHNVYPNPVSDYAFVEYTVHNPAVDARIAIHNILGNTVGDYPLPSSENKVKISAESLNAGIYFYTLYLDNEGVVTRKLIVR